MKQQADGMQLERDIQQELAMKAREAGRREGLESIKQKVEEQCGDHCNNWCWHIKVADIVDALIDSPKAAPARRSPYDFACPRCSVARGEICIHDETLHGKEFHVSRRELADEANLKLKDSPKAEVEES